MNKVKLIALRNTYCKRALAPGELFEASPSVANLMVKCRAARYAEDVLPEPEKRTYRRRDMKAER